MHWCMQKYEKTERVRERKKEHKDPFAYMLLAESIYVLFLSLSSSVFIRSSVNFLAIVCMGFVMPYHVMYIIISWSSKGLFFFV